MHFIECQNCKRDIPEDTFTCPFCENDTGIYDNDFFSDHNLDKVEKLNLEVKFGLGQSAVKFNNPADLITNLWEKNFFESVPESSLPKFLPYKNNLLNHESLLVADAFLSFHGNSDDDIDKKLATSFETEILSVQKQNGSKYERKSKKDFQWKLPMLEVETRHGIYITYGKSDWVWNGFAKRAVSVWTQQTTRKGWLWIHEGISPSKTYTENQNLCEGCCNFQLTGKYTEPF